MKILISTANYNSEKDTLELIENLEGHLINNKDITLSLMIFDNSRTLTLPEYDIKSNLDINVIKPRRNIGLAPTWKVSMSYMLKSDYDCLILVNNDTEFNETFFSILSKAIREDPTNAYGAFITLPDGTPWSTGGQFGKLPWIIDHEAKSRECYPESFYQTEHLSGCCIILPKATIVESYTNLSGLSDFFFRGEEWFLNRRLKELGIKKVILRDAILVHKENGSHTRFSKAHIYWAIRAKMLYIKKLKGATYFFSLLTYILHSFSKGMLFYKLHSDLHYIPLLKVISLAIKHGLKKSVIRERDFG